MIEAGYLPRGTPHAAVRERADPGPTLSEADLSWLWQGQRYPPGALAAADGSPVRVLYPGRRAGGPGPDFRDAVIVARGERRLGDVELHVRASAFTLHGHHLDPAYDRLALHVAYRDDAGGSVRLAGGRSVPTASFAPWVERRRADVAAWLARPALWREPCQMAVARLGGDAVRGIVAAAGRERLLARAALLAARARTHGAERAFWAALLDALALGGDREGFSRLACALPPALLRLLRPEGAAATDVAWTEAALLQVAGLGAGVPDPRLPAPLTPALRRHGTRPANLPERRLRAAARLFHRAGGRPAAFALASVGGAASARDLLVAWRVGPAPPAREALVGTARATELLVNAVLPFAATRPVLAERALALAASLAPVAAYGKTSFLEGNLAPIAGRRASSSALDQQGLLAFHAEWCSRGGCGRCPLSPADP